MTFNKQKNLAEKKFSETFDKSRIGNTFIFLEEVDSTNLYALKNASELPDGTVIIANSQTAGRGRKGRQWISTPGLGLYTSILLKKNNHYENLMLINLLASLSTYEALYTEIGKADTKEKKENNLELKWPNDLVINSRKLGGILSEGYTENKNSNPVAVGIGVNINHTNSDFPDGLNSIATSLFIIDGVKREPWTVAIEIVKRFNYILERFNLFGPDDLLRLWASHAPSVKGERVKIISDKEEFIAVTEGLDSRGFLKVRRYGDRLQTILSADIVSLRRVQ
jgi:BirA family biotin operon repressor/biotin-[acetyl-CoA-carboxylase] ligase